MYILYALSKFQTIKILENVKYIPVSINIDK